MRIAIYTRKSVYIENSESINTQINLCQNYFTGENEFEIFEDEGFSGKNTNRPAFQRLMKLCEMKKFDIVAVYKVDRIARNIVDFVNIYDDLNRLGIKLVSITEGFDPSTPIGKMMMLLLASFADMERSNIAQRVKDNMIQLAKKGCFTGGVVAQGCEVEKINGKSYLKIIAKELIHTYFDSYLEQGSLFLAYKHLSEIGIKISREGYRKVLRNPLYVKSSNEVDNYLKSKQYEVIGKANDKNGYLTYGKINNTSIAVISKHLGVIESSTWLKVQMQLDERKDQFKKMSEVNFLSSFLKCPYCEGYYQLAQANKIKYYVCQNRINRTKTGIDIEKIKCENKKYIRADTLEKKMVLFMKELENKDTFDELFSNNQDREKTSDVDLQKQLEKNNRAINNLIEKVALLSNEASKIILDKIEELTQKNIDIKNKIEVEKLLEMQKKAHENSSEFIYKQVLEFNKITSAKEKNRILKMIFNNLKYDPYTNDIKL